VSSGCHCTAAGLGQLDGLDHAVVGERRRAQPGADAVDGLMVVAADRDRVLAQHAAHRGARPQGQFRTDVAVVPRHVLNQRAAHGHVDYLQAAADGQQRPA